MAAALTALLASGCSQLGAPPSPPAGNAPPACAAADVYREQGLASWYGKTHHGQRTASGQKFDMNGLTAAHRELPFGTKIRVTNPANGRSVVLTVIDRGPFSDGRVLDVSRRAADELGFLRAGQARVQIEEASAC